MIPMGHGTVDASPLSSRQQMVANASLEYPSELLSVASESVVSQVPAEEPTPVVPGTGGVSVIRPDKPRFGVVIGEATVATDSARGIRLH